MAAGGVVGFDCSITHLVKDVPALVLCPGISHVCILYKMHAPLLLQVGVVVIRLDLRFKPASSNIAL